MQTVFVVAQVRFSPGRTLLLYSHDSHESCSQCIFRANDRALLPACFPVTDRPASDGHHLCLTVRHSL